MKRGFSAAIFDLDGVLVDTAKCHYQAWKRLAGTLGITFTEQDNERLKGVSRMQSLEIVLEIGGLNFSEEKKRDLTEMKNRWYVEAIEKLDSSALLNGALAFLTSLNAAGVPVALASASKNAAAVIERLPIAGMFQFVVDANRIARTKPDPEIFLAAAAGLAAAPADCVVFEDAAAGVEAAHAAGMYAVGIGTLTALPEADLVVPSLAQLDYRTLFS